MFFFVFFPLDLGFWCRLGFSVFLAKSDKIWVSEALQFFAAFLVGYILLPVY